MSFATLKKCCRKFWRCPKLGSSSNFKTYDNRGYVKEYRLPKDLTVTLVTGYRADLRYKVVKRLEELESLNQPIELTGSQLMARALIEADETLKAQARQIEHMREDVEAHARLVKAEGSLNITEAAKNLECPSSEVLGQLAA